MATFFTGQSGVGSGPHLDFRIWDVNKGSYVDPRGFTDVLTVGGKPLTEQFGVTSGFGPRNISVPGASKNHMGIDYGTPMDTPVEVAGGTYLTTFDDARGGRMSQYAITRDGKPYDVLLLHGSDKNKVLSDAARTDFDYNTVGTLPLPPSITPTPARVEAKEKATAFIPGALKKYPGIVEKYQNAGASSAPAAMKSPKPAFDVRSRDSDARGGYDPRFDVHPSKR